MYVPTSALAETLGPGPKRSAHARNAMVVTSHPSVTSAAVDVLRAGGGAVDAVLTALPLQQVLEPQLSTPAGGFGMLVHHGPSGRAVYLNAGCDHPTGSGARPSSGPDTSGVHVSVPGTVSGMAAAARRFGTLPWASYFEPAIAAAADGFAMYPQLHTAIWNARGRLLAHASGRERFAPDGFLVPVGGSLTQPALARTLERLAADDGADWFQRGPFARRFVATVDATGGSLRESDLASYEPRWEEPLRYRFRGHDLLAPPPPDTGGLYCAIALQVAQRVRSTSDPAWSDSAAGLMQIAAVLALAEDLVDEHGGDPRGGPAGESLLSHASLDAAAERVGGRRDGVGPAPGGGETRERRVGSNQLVVVDAGGTWVSLLHTGYGTDFGTGLAVDGVGVNSAGWFPGRSSGVGRRVVAPLASTLVADRAGIPWAALGTPGFPPPYVALTLLNLLDNGLRRGLGLAEAVRAPRFAFDPAREDALSVESRFAPDLLEQCERAGVDVTHLGDFSESLGRVNAVAREPDGTLVGVVDPRASGSAAGL